jgi:hypothetical protein
VNLSELIISLIALLVSINALKVTQRVYILTSKEYLPQLQFETSDQDIKIINITSDIFEINEDIQFMKIEELNFVHHEPKNMWPVNLTLVINSLRTRMKESPGKYGKEYYFKTNIYPGWGLSNPDDPNSGYVFRFPWDFHIQPIVISVYNSILSKVISECPYYSKNTYYLVQIKYADKFHNIKTIYYKCSFPSNTNSFLGAEMLEEGEFNKVFSSLITNSVLPKTENLDELWDYLVKTYGQKS